MYNQRKKNKFTFFVVVLAIILFLGYLSWANFYSTDSKIEIDNNNTEVVITDKDIEEISKKLDQLDIDLDDVLIELDL